MRSSTEGVHSRPTGGITVKCYDGLQIVNVPRETWDLSQNSGVCIPMNM